MYSRTVMRFTFLLLLFSAKDDDELEPEDPSRAIRAALRFARLPYKQGLKACHLYRLLLTAQLTARSSALISSKSPLQASSCMRS